MRWHVLFPFFVPLLIFITGAESGLDAERRIDYEIRTVVIYDSLLVTVTYYTSSVYECDDTPFVTSDGTYVYDGIVAVSPDLLNIFSYGDSVYVEDIGWLIIHDLMHDRWKDSIDIWCDDRIAAFANGRKRRMMRWNYRKTMEYVFR